jgi:hypothetical protein
MRIPTFAAFAVAAVLPSPASAQAIEAPSALTELSKCRSLKEDGARLRCYDAAAGELASATSSGSLIVVDKEDLRRTRRSLFGLDLSKLPFFSGDRSAEDEVEQINAKVKRVQVTRDQKWVVELDSGGTWQTTEVDTRQSSPKAGDSVRIRRASLGGFLLSIEGRRSVRALRAR